VNDQPNSLARIRSQLPALSEAEAQVANWILQNADMAVRSSMAQIAHECGVSDATVLRLCRAVGFHGFLDLKISVAQDLASPTQLIHDDIAAGDDPGIVARKVFLSNIQALYDTLEVLDQPAFAEAVEMLGQARQIFIIGVGTSAPIAHDMYNKFFRLGLNCRVQTDSYLQIMEAALLGPHDAVVGISQTGMSKDPVWTLQEARRHGARTLCITGNAQSPITEMADITLLSVSHETRAEVIASRVGQITIIDALYVALSLRDVGQTIQNEKLIWDAVIPKAF
jgi:DNA-binding MurR/RpiR family transcriptional regulator